ncbi:DgyrCDS8302 [Dimorphilus gyrociliatus]|uniref:Methionine--tRNA ligase, mitochondrial n=1 Tax=Dimorphilus gyrociliatus TaxID=2664684 RepID=A0A7I8VVZ6_9ANNE|nr:DgyrCDS8302 [Dimorphilus gyrociliatus]
MKQLFRITTPIFYANSVPHIGHVYTALIADAAARWNILLGKDTLFSTGTDEHGLKVERESKKKGLNTLQFCNKISKQFQHLFDDLDIKYTDFIRTTEQRHFSAVKQFWEKLRQNGMIYKDSYSGYYSIVDECFITKDELIKSKNEQGEDCYVSKSNYQPVIWMEEENYMFKLSEFTDPLRKWLDTKVIYPEHFENTVRSWLNDGLPDLSISRSKERLHWGIPVPEDGNQVIYVWLDALVNYLTVCNYFSGESIWPVDCHIVGKDILKFHAIYWPAFLMGAGLQLPKKIVCHSHWTVNNLKMSKSIGNVVDPQELATKYQTDGLRYFLLREGTLGSDGNFCEKRMIEVLNAELCNVLGNLLNRVSSQSINKDQIFPAHDELIFKKIADVNDHNLLFGMKNLTDSVGEKYEQYEFHRAIVSIMDQLRNVNSFVDRHKPWILAKENKKEELDCILNITMENLRICGILLQPIIPRLSDRLLTTLGIGKHERTTKHLNTILNLSTNKPICSIGSLYSRIKI